MARSIYVNIYDAIGRRHDAKVGEDSYYPVVAGALAGYYITAIENSEAARRAIIDGNRDLAVMHLDSILGSDPRKDNA